MSNADVLQQLDRNYRMPAPPNCPPKLYELMLDCWHRDPLARPTFETVQWRLDDFFVDQDGDYKEAVEVL